jgi:hypothetical protein
MFETGERDCSDANYRCMKTSTEVLAVPRGPLSPDSSYAVAGTQFAVKECLRGLKNVCQVALIRADCPSIEILSATEIACEIYPGGRDKAPGPITYFIYNEDYGVTSIGFPSAEGRSDIEIEKLARTYVLQGDAGLLKR